MKPVLTLLAIFLFFSTSPLCAQTFEEYKKEQEKTYNTYVTEQLEAFQHYKDSVNQAFAKHLSKPWIKKKTAAKPKPVSAPKPKTPPAVDQTQAHKAITITPKKVIKVEKEANKERPKDDFRKTIVEEHKEEIIKEITSAPLQKSFLFYDEKLPIAYHPISLSLSTINNTTIGDAWEELSKQPYTPIIAQLTNYAMKYNLNDWGYMLLVRDFSKALFDNDMNKATTFTWFILFNTGYQTVRTAYSGNKMYLLIPSYMTLYGIQYFEDNGTKLYAFDLENIRKGADKMVVNNHTDLTTYNTPYFGEVVEEFDFYLIEPFNFNKNNKTRTIDITIDDKPVHVKIDYNTQITALLNEYPPCEPQVYFEAPLSISALRSLRKELSPYLEGKSEEEKVQFLLHFVQKSFDYKVDKEQFGYERWLFTEEIFAYPYADCEDRSSLFAQLVTLFTDCDVVGLRYPGHMSTAVKFSNQALNGDAVTYKGSNYLICDPTYFYAKIGLTQTAFKNTKPEIIPFI